jgi:hypothetical protein
VSFAHKGLKPFVVTGYHILVAIAKIVTPRDTPDEAVAAKSLDFLGILACPPSKLRRLPEKSPFF